MSYVKFMRTFRCFLEFIGVPKTEAQGVKYNYIRRFLPTLGEVLRVDTTEAQSLSNWIEGSPCQSSHIQGTLSGGTMRYT